MRASELLGRRVRDPDGLCGRVVDLRSRIEENGALVIVGLVVSNRRRRLMGYERLRHPRLIASLLQRLHRRTRYATWDQVDVGTDVVSLRCGWDELQAPSLGVRTPRLGTPEGNAPHDDGSETDR